MKPVKSSQQTVARQILVRNTFLGSRRLWHSIVNRTTRGTLSIDFRQIWLGRFPSVIYLVATLVEQSVRANCKFVVELAEGKIRSAYMKLSSDARTNFSL